MMPTRMDAITAYYQDQGVNEQKRHDEDTPLKVDENMPPTGHSKKEQNRLAAQKMRAKHRSTKNMMEDRIKHYEVDNLKLSSIANLIKNDIAVLTNFMKNVAKKSPQEMNVLDIDEESYAAPATVNLILHDKTQPLVMETPTAPARAEVAPPATSAAPTEDNFNVPNFFDSDQLPTQVDTKSKTSKIVESEPLFASYQPCEEQGLRDEELSGIFDMGIVTYDPMIKEILDDMTKAPLPDTQHMQMTMNTQMAEFSKDSNTELDFDFLNKFDNISQNYLNPDMQYDNYQNMDTGFNQFSFPGNHNPEYGDPFYNEPQVSGYEMVNTGFRLDPIGQSLNPVTGYYEPTPPGVNIYDNDAFLGMNPSFDSDVYP